MVFVGVDVVGGDELIVFEVVDGECVGGYVVMYGLVVGVYG